MCACVCSHDPSPWACASSSLSPNDAKSASTLVMKHWMPVFFLSFYIKLFITVCNLVGIIIIGHLRIFGGYRIGIFQDDIRINRVIILAAQYILG